MGRGTQTPFEEFGAPWVSGGFRKDEPLLPGHDGEARTGDVLGQVPGVIDREPELDPFAVEQ